MRSYIKLYGPSIDKGLDGLDDLLKNLGKGYPYGDMVTHIISIVDPSLDLMTNKLVSGGRELLGECDYVIEWSQIPNHEQVRSLIKRIDSALLYTGCRYTIVTRPKEKDSKYECKS
jgi:hypothetical protein